MLKLTVLNCNEELKKILSPMFKILDKKNIIDGISVIEDKDKLFLCFDRRYLSNTNQLILEGISFVYNETIFYSNDSKMPNNDRLEYWCPDKVYDAETHITERCRNKILFVLELNSNKQFIILGTTIMLANTLQEQDPLSLKINDELLVIDEQLLERHNNYLLAGCPDQRWINLNIILDRENSLRNNCYAPTMSICDINSSILCDNMYLAAMAGYKEKTYVTFCMNKEDLTKAIESYFNSEEIALESKKLMVKVLNSQLS